MDKIRNERGDVPVFEALEPRLLLDGAAYIVNSLTDAVEPDGMVTLREAIQAANTNTAVTDDVLPGSAVEVDIITFDQAALQTEAGLGNPLIITLDGAQLEITDDLDIQGLGADVLSIDADGRSRVLDVSGEDTDVDLSGLTITGGSTPDGGGGIYNYGGVLTLTNSTVSGNWTDQDGGGIHNRDVMDDEVILEAAVLTLTNSTVSGNSAGDDGGGIYNFSSTFTLTGSMVLGNSASHDGGGIYIYSGALMLTNSLVAGNSADAYGGGIENWGALTVTNSTVSGNSTNGFGGGIANEFGTLTLNNTIVALNGAPTGADIYGSYTNNSSLVSVDPRFEQNPGPGIDGVWGTEDDDKPRLGSMSLAINMGDNALVVDGEGLPLTADLDGNPRIGHWRVDAGAYEYLGTLPPVISIEMERCSDFGIPGRTDDSYEYLLDVVGYGMTGGHVITPWGETVDISEFLTEWNVGEEIWFQSREFEFGVCVEDGRTVFKFEWNWLSESQWASLDTGETTLGIVANAGAWEETFDFAGVSQPSDEPGLFNPIHRTILPHDFLVEWSPWIDPPTGGTIVLEIEEETFADELDRYEGWFELPVDATSWTPPSGLILDGIYELDVSFAIGAEQTLPDGVMQRIFSDSENDVVCLIGDDPGQWALDDHGNSYPDATPIIGPGLVAGNLGYIGDIDFFRFNAVEGTFYEILVDSSANPGQDTVLWLYDSDGRTLLTWDDDGGGNWASRIRWVAPADGAYYVAVDSYDFYEDLGLYTIQVSPETLTPDLPAASFNHPGLWLETDGARGVVVSDELYTGTTDDEDDEDEEVLHVLDLSNPEVPVEIGSWYAGDMEGGAFGPHGFFYCVVDGSGDPNGPYAELVALDISGGDPVEVYSIRLQREDADSLAIVGNFAYVGTQPGGNDAALEIYDLSNPSGAAIQGQVQWSSPYGYDADPEGLAVVDGVAYVLHEESRTISLIDVSDPDTPSLLGQYTASLPGLEIWGLAAADGMAWYGAGNELYGIDVSDPANPAFRSSIDLGGKVDQILIRGTNAHVGCASLGAVIVDISDPDSPAIVRTVVTPGATGSVAVSGGRLFIPTFGDKTAIFVLNVPGDFNGDGGVDAADIDALAGAIRSSSSDLKYDLNVDGYVDSGDMDYLVLNTLNTLYGDSNLDGEIDADDWDAFIGSFGMAAGWAGCDFNGDGRVDLRDLAIVRASFGRTPVPPTPAPDLAVSVQEAPLKAFSDEAFDLSWTVTNAGDLPADAAGSYDYIYLSQDAILDGGDIELWEGDAAIEYLSLAPGASHTWDHRLTMPLNDIPGLTWDNGYLIFVADGYHDVVADINRANNIVARPIQLFYGYGDIAGTVTDFETGSPLEGIRIDVYRGNDPARADHNAWQWVDQVVTGPDGSYQSSGLPVRNYRLGMNYAQESNGQYYVESYLTNVLVANGSVTGGQDIALRPAGNVWGYVYDDAGQPLENAEVLMHGKYTEEGDDWWHSTFTDDMGLYTLYLSESDTAIYPIQTIRAVGPGDTYQVYAKNVADTGNPFGSDGRNVWDILYGDLVSEGFDYLGESSTTETFSGGYNFYVIQTDAYTQIAIDGIENPGGDWLDHYLDGNVDWNRSSWDWQNLPDDGACLYLGWPENLQANAFMSGSYQTLPASVTVHVADLGLPDTPVYYGAQLADGLHAASLAGVRGPDFNLAPGAILRGRIITEDGDPFFVTEWDVPLEVEVQTANGDIDSFRRTIDADGYWEVSGIPAGVDATLVTTNWLWERLNIEGVKYSWGERWVDTYNLAPGQVLDIGTLTIPRAATISGKVTDSTGQPIIGAEVGFVGLTALGGEIDIEDDLFTDESGRYSLDWIPPGQVTVSVRAVGYPEYLSETITLNSSDDVIHDAALTPWGSGIAVSGEITNYDDIAPKNATGDLLPWSILDEYDSVNLPGWVEVVALPAGFSFDPDLWLGHVIQPTGWADVEDGYGDYFVPGVSPAGSFAMDLPAVPQSLFALREGRDYYSGDSLIFSDIIEIDAAGGAVVSDIEINIPVGTTVISGDFIVPGGYSPGLNSYNTAAAILCKSGGPDAGQWRAVGGVNVLGGYLMEDIPAGTYYIAGVARGLETYVSQEFTVVDGQQIVRDIVFNLPPPGAPLSDITVDENSPDGTVIGTSSAPDPDGDAVTFTPTDFAIMQGDFGNTPPAPTAAPIAEFTMPVNYIPEPQIPYRATTSEYDLRSLGDDPAADQADDLLADILAESPLAILL